MNKATKILIVKLIICAGLFGFLLSRMSLSRFGVIFSDIRWPVLFLAYALLFVNTSLSALKWKILLKADGVDISLDFLLKSYLVGTFMNLFLPSSVGGDVMRIYDVAQRSQSVAKSAASVFMDRMSGFFALALIGFIASLLGSSYLNAPTLQWTLFGVFGVIILAFLAVLYKPLHDLVGGILKRLPINKPASLFEKVTLSLQAYSSRKDIMGKMLAISFAFQGLVIVIVYLYGEALQFDTRFFWFMIFIPIITIIESVPLTPFSLGTRDMAYLFFFSRVGLQKEQAVSLALLYVGMTVAYALLGGIIFVFRQREE